MSSINSFGHSVLKDLGSVGDCATTSKQRADAAITVRKYAERANALDDLEMLLEMLDVA